MRHNVSCRLVAQISWIPFLIFACQPAAQQSLKGYEGLTSNSFNKCIHHMSVSL